MSEDSSNFPSNTTLTMEDLRIEKTGSDVTETNRKRKKRKNHEPSKSFFEVFVEKTNFDPSSRKAKTGFKVKCSFIYLMLPQFCSFLTVCHKRASYSTKGTHKILLLKQ